MPVKLSTKGAKFIARWEGMVLHPYNDPVGYATVGVGHLLHRSKVTALDRIRWMRFKKSDAYALLQKDASRFSVPLTAHAKNRGWKLTQPQFDALVSFSFNVGTGWMANSTLDRVLTRGFKFGKRPDSIAVTQALAMWNKAGGRAIPGLWLRRHAEAKLFNTGRYS